MFETFRKEEPKEYNNHNGRSHFGETMQLEGDIRSTGALDLAGLINGNVFVSEITISDTGSVRGQIEAKTIEINGHIEGKVSADSVIVGKNAVIKGDIFFKDTLKTELLNAMKNQNDGKEDPDGNMSRYAEEIADAIHKYVRTGEVNVPDEGNKPVR